MLTLAVFFLAPWTAALTLAGAASVPIIIHLLNRKRFRVVEWAAMRFLLAAQKRAKRKLRLEQWLLLAVRTLLVILLILAMLSVLKWMEPVWARLFPGGVAGNSARVGRTHKILLVDGSYSMARRHADGNSFDRAVQFAKRIVESGNPGDGFSLVLLGSPATSVVPGPSDNTASVLRELDALRLPHGNSDLAGGLAAVEKMFGGPLGKYQQREVYLLTDLQRTAFQVAGLRALGGRTVPGSTGERPAAEADAWQRVQVNASVIVVDVAREGADNLAVTNLTLGEPLALAGTQNTVTATLHNFGAKEAVQVAVALHIGKARGDGEDGKPAGEAFKFVEAEKMLVDVPAGAAVPVTFSYTFNSPGEYVVRVEAADDVLSVDNTRSLVVPVKDRVPVLLIDGKPAADRDDRATHHLAVALNPAGEGAPGSLSGMSPFRPRVITEAQFADVKLGDLGSVDCVFVCDVAQLSERKIERLENFLRRGGGVVFTLGSQVDAEAFNRLLFNKGNGIVPARLVKRIRASEGQHFTLTGDDEAFQQPPLAAFSADNDRGTLLAARIREYYQVELPAKVAVKKWLSFLPPQGVKPGAGAKTTLDPAMLEWRRHRGRVMLITTTMNIDWGSWPGSPAFLPLAHELARHAALGAPPRVVATGESLLDYLPSQLGRLGGTVATPDGRTAAVALEGQEDAAVFRFPETHHSGIYRLVVGAGKREYMFAVNPPASTATATASESDLNRIAPGEMESGPDDDVQVVVDLSEIKIKARALATNQDGETPRSSAGPAVARYLLLAFLTLLVVEMVLAWRFGSARTVVPPEGAAPPASPGFFARWLRPSTLAYIPLLLAAAVALALVHESWFGEFLGFLPDAVRRAIERFLGVSEAAPGEGTRWRLDYMAYLTGQGAADLWLGFALLAGLTAFAAIVYRYERIASRVRVPGDADSTARPMLPLAAMRLALLFLALAVLLPQLRLFFEREGWPDIVLIIDTSKSVGKPDDYQDSDVKDRTEQLGIDWSRLAKPKIEATNYRITALEAERKRNPSPERLPALERELADARELLGELRSSSRLNLIKALVAGADDDWITKLFKKRQVKVHVYECGPRATRLTEVIDETGATAAIEKIRDLRPLGEASQLGGAVRTVLNDFRGGSLGAIVMLTDGVTTEGEDLAAIGRVAAGSDVPLFFVGVGDAHEPRDLLLHDIQGDDTVSVRDRLVIDARVSVKGKLEATTVLAQLFEKKNGELIERARETVTLDPGKPTRVRLVTTPTEPGDHTYVIALPEFKEESDKINNRAEKLVHVADAKPVKVLYIEGYPRYEYRFLKSLLEREALSKQGNRSIQLKVLLADADREFAVQDKSAIAELPAKDELFAFDVIILGDVDPRHAKLGEKNLQLLRDFVRERGGGMLFIAGEQNMPAAYRDTPLADVLPIVWGAAGEIADPNEQRQLQLDLNDGYPLRLSPIGRQHPIFRLATEDDANAAAWADLAPLHFAASGYKPKPAAEVLATHPTLRARRASGEADDELHPLVVQSFVGAGRSMFFGFDETWRWRYREHEPKFNQFWVQTAQYLARTRLGRVDLRLDKQTPYRRNEPIRVTVRFPDDAPAPPADAPVRVLKERSRLRRVGEKLTEPLDHETLTLAKVKGSRATYESLVARTPEGEYKFWLAAPAVDGLKPQVEGRVLPPPGELDRLRMNQAEMELAARQSNGKFYNFAEAGSLLDELPSGTRVTLNQPRPPWLLWNHPLMFLLVLGLLTCEWVMRKRRRLL